MRASRCVRLGLLYVLYELADICGGMKADMLYTISTKGAANATCDGINFRVEINPIHFGLSLSESKVSANNIKQFGNKTNDARCRFWKSLL